MHTSVKLDSPVEFINLTPLNPLISKCQIKVCYVGDTPNRNGSIITKETAKQMANSLPGCPIVGYYNEDKADFEEHNRIIDISNGEFRIKDTTRPYGFVDLNAKVWFQKFLDDGVNEREYMMTEGWLWTGQYPECQRILQGAGNNQSMELDENTLNASWSKQGNEKQQFFIINEAIISKLCTLGVDNEPCFEGASISAPVVQFAFDDGFKNQLFSMMNELKECLSKGGEKMSDLQEVVVEEQVEPVVEPVVIEEEVAAAAEVDFAKKDDEKEEEKICPKCGKPESECECDEDEEKSKNEDKKEKYNLEEIQEYMELSSKYSDLETKYAEAQATIDALNAAAAEVKVELESLRTFKATVEKKQKEEMIDSFYMLSNEDKKDVVANIDTYSLDDIEAKLSILCVRNKVNFNLDNDKSKVPEQVYTLNLDGGMTGEETVPAWIQVLRSVASEK